MSVLTIYQTDITPDKNAVVNNIDDYLGTFVAKSYDVQYQKIALDLTIKLAEDQKYVGTQLGNYAKLVQDDRNYYFFIKSSSWTAKDTVRLYLVLDTLNTYWDELDWNDKTNITRQHRDRYSGYSNGKLKRYIDYYNEGLNPIKTVEYSNNTLTDGSSKKWYIVYTANNQLTQDNTTDPIRALILNNSSETILDGYSGNDPVTITFDPQANDYYYWITGSDNSNNTTTVTYTVLRPTGGTQVKTCNIGVDTLDDTAVLRAILIDGAYITRMYYTGNSYPYTYYKSETDTNSGMYFTINNERVYHKVPHTSYYGLLQDLSSIDGLNSITINAGTVPAIVSRAYSDFDRSDSRFTKIIECPYQPGDVSNWKVDYGYKTWYKVLDDNSFGCELNNISSPFALVMYDNATPAKGQPYSYVHESKLYNSEFFDVHLTYDNATTAVKLENIVNAGDNINLGAHWYMSNDMSCTKAFKWWVSSDDDTTHYMLDSDFEDYLISTRNTEKPIYTAGYADYIKNGYNYDQEANKMQNRNAIVNGVMNVVGGAVSLATQIPSGLGTLSTMTDWSKAMAGGGLWNTPKLHPSDLTPEARKSYYSDLSSTTGFAGLVAGQGMSAFSSAYNAFASIESNNKSFAHGLEIKQASNVNIQGSASTDIMDIYGGGKLRLIARWLRSKDRQNIAKMFYYTGYSYPVQEIPDFDSRLYFNFVQCNPTFNYEHTSVYSDYLDDIKNRFRLGVTVYHNVDGKWDFNQQYENWETSLINE